jgi:hypothetical protein
MIHLGDQAAVVVPMADFLKLRALERQASAEELADAEDIFEEKAINRAAGGSTCATVGP